MNHYYTSVEVIGNSVAVRAIDANGDRVQYKDKTFRPEMFIPSNDPTSKYESISGEKLELIQPGNIKESRDWISQYSGSNFDIYGNERFLYQYMGKHWPEDMKWDMSKIRVLNIDIECECEFGFPQPEIAPEPIHLITMEVDGNYVTLGTKEYTGTQPGQKFKYIRCADEHDLMTEFVSIWKKIDPDVVTGWNVNFFDMPYIVNRLEHLFGEGTAKQLSPWRKLRERNVSVMGRTQQTWVISGVSTLDYFDLYKKNTYTDRESFKLDYIAHIELGERKLSHDEHANMHLFYKNDWNKYVEYNVQDVCLVRKLDDKLKLMELNITRAYDACVNYEDIFSQVRTWDAIIYNWLRKKNIIVPLNRDTESEGAYVGAYVKEPQAGLHEWVMSFDLNSLYPHLMMEFNISPDTYVGKRQDVSVDSLLGGYVQADDPECTLAANGAMYRKDKQGFLPEIMQKMYNDRKEAKRQMIWHQQELQKDPTNKKHEYEISRLNNKQMAAKIALNSAYGAMGSQYHRFYDTINATAITTSGQLAIRWIERKLNEYFQKVLKTEDDYVIASDTDSVYLNCKGIVDVANPDSPIDFLDKFGEEVLTPYIDRCYQELAERVNAYEQKMVMGREVIADKGIWVKKKRYILNVHDSEGVRYTKPKLKIMGIETQKSSTPEICRGALLEAFQLIIDADENAVRQYCDEFQTEFLQAGIEEVSSPRGVKGLRKFSGKTSIYVKSTPLHVKGALIYNHMLKERGLDKKYPLINEGEKIKYAYLQLPNPTKDTVISFPSILPDEFDLDRFVDRQKQFEKSFLDPLDAVLDAIGWTREHVDTLFG
jgi:DNA polymerase elongation subunit (family B)